MNLKVVLALFLGLQTLLSGATITVLNLNQAGNGLHGIADSLGTRLGGEGSGGMLGRFTISDTQVEQLVGSGNFVSLDAAFARFGGENAIFSLDSLGEPGAVQASVSHPTHAASGSGFGGNPIYVWCFQGETPATATEMLLVRLETLFVSDADPLVPELQEVFVRPQTITKIFSGAIGPQTHNYFGSPDGVAATLLRMAPRLDGNLPPVAFNGSLNAVSGVPKAGQVTGEDPEGQPITFTKLTDPAHGTVVLASDGSFTYTAGPDYAGADSFQFAANDGQWNSPAATISITVESPPADQRPVAQDASFVAYTALPLAGALEGSDPNNDPITFLLVAGPAHGGLSLAPDGSFAYTSNPGYTGPDGFTFRTSDGVFLSATATVTIDVQVPPENQPPVAHPAVLQMRVNDLLRGQLTASDFENHPLSFTLVTQPVSGVAVVNPDGSFFYRPNSGFAGEDSFSFRAADPFAPSEPATVVVSVRQPTPVWQWMGGSAGANANGTYGAQGIPGVGNTPGARGESASAQTGNTGWLFGGFGRGENGGVSGLLSDLWRLDLDSGSWIWLAGGKGVNDSAVYGTKGEAAASNRPGGRRGAAMWAGPDGRLWLFGGFGRGNSAVAGPLNDLWSFDPATGVWTWEAGAAAPGANGVYGTRGVAAAANTPGARFGAAAWRDGVGRFWLFGGRGRGGFVAGGGEGDLADMWCFDPGTGMWSCMGLAEVLDLTGTYGAAGVEGPLFRPGGRSGAAAWTDPDGSLWLFGGRGRGTVARQGALGDLWRFSPASLSWAWMGGPRVIDAAPVRGVLGSSHADWSPGGRAGAAAWTGTDGALWLCGGAGRDGFSDVWRYDPDTNQWCWVKGHAALNQAGVHGQLGVPSVSNTPGSRAFSSVFASGQHTVWLLGGVQRSAVFNDTWRLNLGPGPVVDFTAVHSITNQSATFRLRASPFANAGDTTVSILLKPAGRNGSPMEVILNPLPAGLEWVDLEHEVEGLESGVEYLAWVRLGNAAGRAVSSVRWFITAGAPAPPVAAFSSATSTTMENAGRHFVEVSLTAPAPSAFSIPVTAGGSATPGTFALNPAQVSFVPGQSRAWLTVTLFDNQIVDGDRLLNLTLGTPSPGGVATGSPALHAVTILDDDIAPNVVAQPVGVAIRAGEILVLQADIHALPPWRAQWKRDGRDIRGATGSVFHSRPMRLVDSGLYTLEVTDARGVRTTSNAVPVVVAEPRSQRVVVARFGAAELEVRVSGEGATVQWLREGSSDVLGSQPKHSFASAQADDSGIYICRVSAPGATPLDLPFELSATSTSPRFDDLTRLPDAFVGSPYEFQLTASNAPGGEAERFFASNLPPGLTISPDGWIRGVPRSAVINRPVTVSGRNAAGTGGKPVFISVLAVPAGIIGAYQAVSLATGGVAEGMGGSLDLTVTAAGSFTAFWQGAAGRVRARGTLRRTATLSQGTAVFNGRGLPPLVVEFELRSNVSAGSFELTGTVTDEVTGESAALQGVKLAPPPPVLATTYHFGMRLVDAWTGALSVPQGAGYGVVRILATGRVSCSGRTGDGAAYACSRMRGAHGDVPFLAQPSVPGAPAVVCGLLKTVTATSAPFIHGIQGAAAWSRAQAANNSRVRGYRDGFGPVGVDISGGVYVGPAAGGVIAGLPGGDNNARISFETRALFEAAIAPVQFTILNAGGVRQRVVMPANPGFVTFRLDGRVPGVFGGGFRVAGATASLNRAGVFNGLFVRHINGGFEAFSHYLLALPPEPGATGRTAPELSGNVIVEPVGP
jgi:hypothetical protein